TPLPSSDPEHIPPFGRPTSCRAGARQTGSHTLPHKQIYMWMREFLSREELATQLLRRAEIRSRDDWPERENSGQNALPLLRWLGARRRNREHWKSRV